MATPAPAATSGTTCPACGAAVPAGSRFCNACGASMAPSTPATGGPSSATTGASNAAAGGATPVDLRQRVEQDRGVLKRLQLLVPGYAGYRQGEDIRAADSLLRLQVADKIKNSRATLENARQALVNANQFNALTDMAPLIADLMRLEGEIRHAEQGYTGISPAVRINPTQLDRLYEYDFGFAQAADQLAQTVAGVPALAMAGNAGALGQSFATARGQVNQLEQAFKARIQAIEGIRVS